MCCLLQVLVVEAAIRAVTMEDRLMSMRVGRDGGMFTAHRHLRTTHCLLGGHLVYFAYSLMTTYWELTSIL